MRYYYAIIECDSDKTASAIYESCDGVEFENSSIHMDLRFVPDEMTFEVFTCHFHLFRRIGNSNASCSLRSSE